LVVTKSVTLHLAFDDIKRMAQEPKKLPRKTAAYCKRPALNLASLLARHPCDMLDEALVRGEPDSVAMEFAKNGDGLAAVDA
jgi:hypothetical protein